MLTVLTNFSAMLLGEVLFAPAPPNLRPANEIERMVLTRSESASRELENWLAQTPKKHRNRKLVEAGFRRIRPGIDLDLRWFRFDEGCAYYSYSRQLTATTIRGADISLCDGKPPFVLRSDMVPGPYTAPKSSSAPGVITAPSAPRSDSLSTRTGSQSRQ